MYNGIGLQTSKGSGTNGHVQTNKFFVKPKIKGFEGDQGTAGVSRKANTDIEHHRKRQIELKFVVLEEKLTDQGYTEAEISEKLQEARNILESADNVDFVESEGAATALSITEKKKNIKNLGSSKRISNQNRANWSAKDTTLFLELLVGEKKCGNWCLKSPTPKGYDNIIYIFQQKMMTTFNRKQLKSKHEALRNLFRLWTNMFNSQTDASFNATTGGMTMESRWWDDKIKENDAYKKFRNGGLENVALLYQVYGDNVVSGTYQCTHTALNHTFRNSHVYSSPPRNQVNENNEVNSLIQSREDSGHSCISRGKRKSSSRDTWNASLMDSLRQEFKLSFRTPLKYSIKHVTVDEDAESTKKGLNILYEMKNLESNLFDAGCALMEIKIKKNIFLCLRNDADRLRFLQRNVNYSHK